MRPSSTPSAREDPGAFPPLQRIEVERLARCDPAGVGLHMTPWSTRSLALAARDRGIAPTNRRGHIERWEHESVRHGTVTFLAALSVPTGAMWGRCLGVNDSASLRPALHALFTRLARRWRRVHLIRDEGSSHVSAETAAFLRDYAPHVRVLRTPAHASWLNQGELLVRAFSARYLGRGDWASRVHLADHLEASWREYNRLSAHPFTWSRARYDLRTWMRRHAA